MIYFYFYNFVFIHPKIEKMIKHIVMFKVKAQNPEEKTARLNKLKNMLDSLKSSIREIQMLETGMIPQCRQSGIRLP